MPRSTSKVIWTFVLVILGLLGLAAAVFGPRLYQEGKAFVAPIADDVARENQELFWRHRHRIAAIGDPSANPLHGILREGDGVVITVYDDGQPVLGPPPERVEQN